jgi:hypothetical protein
MAGADERMTIATYLEHRRWVEVAAVVSTMFLVAATQTTTEVIDNLRQGLPSDWLAAAAKELTSGVAVLAMLPALVAFLRWLDLRWSNLRWRVLWHVPAFLVFSFGHILLFTLMRILIWAAAGDRYNTGPLGLGLLYEMRKDLLLYLLQGPGRRHHRVGIGVFRFEVGGDAGGRPVPEPEVVVGQRVSVYLGDVRHGPGDRRGLRQRRHHRRHGRGGGERRRETRRRGRRDGRIVGHQVFRVAARAQPPRQRHGIAPRAADESASGRDWGVGVGRWALGVWDGGSWALGV